MKSNRNLRLLIYIGCCVILHFSGVSQNTNQQKYLEKTGILDSLYSELLSEYRKIYIQFPADYNPKANKKYPVVYILDGEVLLPTVKNFQNFYSGGFTPEMILVGISNATHRTRDLTTSEITEKYGNSFPEENGQAENFTAFLEEELFPFIDQKYPVTTYRTLIGHSYGGLFTLNTLVKHPDLFTNYLAIDPSLDWDAQKLLKESKVKLAQNNYAGKNLFMSLNGQLDMQNPNISLENVMQDTTNFTVFARSNIEFSNLLKENAANGLTYNWKFYPRDIHGTVAFPSIMDGLIALFDWFQMENTAKFNSPDTSVEELSNIINHRAKKLENHFGYQVPPYPEELLNALGYMSLDMEQLIKSKMFFEFGIEFYPDSPNVYDSMSEFYERTGDDENAIQFAEKANSLSNDDYFKERLQKLKQQ